MQRIFSPILRRKSRADSLLSSSDTTHRILQKDVTKLFENYHLTGKENEGGHRQSGLAGPTGLFTRCPDVA